MSKIETGGPAFPVPMVMTDGGQGIVSADELDLGGMTLRDYFAAKAMQGLLANRGTCHPKDAYEMADAMLKAREAA